MSELWAIAFGEKIVAQTNANTADGAWRARFGALVTEVPDFIESRKRIGYSAVRLKCEIVERDGEESNGPK